MTQPSQSVWHFVQVPSLGPLTARSSDGVGVTGKGKCGADYPVKAGTPRFEIRRYIDPPNVEFTTRRWEAGALVDLDIQIILICFNSQLPLLRRNEFSRYPSQSTMST